MFILKEDLGTALYSYQIEEITEGNDDIVLQAIAAAETEVKSYLTANNKREWRDGRLRYDVKKIFGQRGAERNALLVSHTATIAKWYIVDLCNADIIYQHAKERYDRAIEYLQKINKGEVSLGNIPTLQDTNQENPQKENIHNKPFSFGSRNKFNHE